MKGHVSDRAIGLAALLGSVSLWASSYSAIDTALASFGPMTIAFLRVILALALVLAMLWRTGARPALGGASALIGLFGYAVMILLQSIGMQHTSSGNAVLIFAGALPAAAVLFAAPLLSERASWRTWICLGGSVAGVAVVAVAGTGVDVAPVGDLLILGAAVSGGLFTVLLRKVAVDTPLLPLLGGTLCYAALYLVPPLIWELWTQGGSVPTPTSLVLVGYLGAGVTALGALLYSVSLRYLDAGPVAILGNLDIPIGLLIAVLLVGEQLQWPQLAGAGLIIASACLVVATTTESEPRVVTVAEPVQQPG